MYMEEKQTLLLYNKERAGVLNFKSSSHKHEVLLSHIKFQRNSKFTFQVPEQVCNYFYKSTIYLNPIL